MTGPDIPDEAVEGEPRRRVVVGLVLVAGFGAVLAVALLGIPREHAPLPAIARYAMTTSLPKWKLTEPVNEVVYGTRGFDTFGETFLLLAAVISVIVLTRPREARRGYFGEATAGRREQSETDPSTTEDASEEEARQAEDSESADGSDGAAAPWAGRPEYPDLEPLGESAPEHAEGMTVVIRTGVRIVAPVLAVGGLYLAAWGFSPGGGFPGGAVLVGVLLFAYAAYGRRKIARVARPELLETIELAGASVIIGTELLGLILRGSFSANWLPLAPPQTIRSGGIIQLFSGGELIEVGTGLAIVIFSLLGMRHDWSPDEDEDRVGVVKNKDGQRGRT
jgi:multicomponent Na+:H+ antiporter subunit B